MQYACRPQSSSSEDEVDPHPGIRYVWMLLFLIYQPSILMDWMSCIIVLMQTNPEEAKARVSTVAIE